MKLGRMLLWINAFLFVAFGLGFVVAPEVFSGLFTGASPSTTSAMIDMRATYGGMALGLAGIFGLCARSEMHVPLGLQGVLAVMTGLAAARTLGIMMDGSPNLFMYLFLGAEVLMGALALMAIRSGFAEASAH